MKSSIAIHITEPKASFISCKMATFSWTNVIKHNRHIHYILHCTFTSLNLHLVFNTMLPMSYQKYPKNPCLYTNYHTFLSSEILHKENVLLSVEYVNYLEKPNIISTHFCSST